MLFYKLIKYGLDLNTVKLLRDMYEKTSICLKLNGRITPSYYYYYYFTTPPSYIQSNIILEYYIITGYMSTRWCKVRLFIVSGSECPTLHGPQGLMFLQVRFLVRFY